MRKTVVLLLGAAFVASLPSVASAKKRYGHHHYRHAVSATSGSENAGPRLVANALHQLVVPLEVTFTPSAPPPRRHYRHRRYR
jgi:hypothetical protein